ncbi:sensor histidine kinase [Leptospira perolatii]|nr:sensor histidine kinase [Leptospira perolatii]
MRITYSIVLCLLLFSCRVPDSLVSVHGEFTDLSGRKIQIPAGQIQPNADFPTITLSIPVSEEWKSLLQSGAPLSIYSGKISGRAAFYLDGNLIGKVGEEFKSGHARFFLSSLPSFKSDQIPQNFRIELSKSEDFPLEIKGPIYVGKSDDLYRWHFTEQFIDVSLCSLFLLIAFCYIFLYVRRPVHRHNLLFGLFMLFAAVYWFMRMDLRESIFGGEVILRLKIEYATLFLTAPLLTLSLENLYSVRTHIAGKIQLAICSFLAIGAVLLEPKWMFLALTIWEALAVPAILYTIYLNIKAMLEKEKTAFLIGPAVLVLIAFCFYDILNDFFHQPQEQISKFAFLFFAISLSLAFLEHTTSLEKNIENLLHFTQSVSGTSYSIDRHIEVGKFACYMIHDLKNDLSTIGYLCEALNPNDSKKNAWISETILEQVHSLRNKTTDILDFVNGTYSIKKKEVPILDFLIKIRESLLPAVQKAGHAFTIDCPYENETVVIDETSLERALKNLIYNSLSAMEKGGTVQLSFRKEKDALVFVVSDNGPGFPADWQDVNLRQGIEGHGLGLRITKSIVEGHQGKLECSSSQGGGTRFEITIPA